MGAASGSAALAPASLRRRAGHCQLASGVRQAQDEADPERGRKLAREARRQAEASHTWEHRATTILEALEG